MDQADLDFLNFMIGAITDPEGDTKFEQRNKTKKDLDIMIHIFMVGSLTPRFMKWINKRVQKDEDKYLELYLSSKYRYNEYLRGTTPSRYKDIRKIIAVSEECSEQELGTLLVEYSDGTSNYEKLKTYDDWCKQICNVEYNQTRNERKFTLDYCYRKYILGLDIDSGLDISDPSKMEEAIINERVLGNLSELSAQHRNIQQINCNSPDSNKIVKRILDADPKFKPTLEMGVYPREMAEKAISLYSIPPSDFESISVSRASINSLANKIIELKKFEEKCLKEDQVCMTQKELDEHLKKIETECLHAGMISAKLAQLYSDARTIGIEYMDAKDKYQELFRKHANELNRLKDLEEVQKTKQNLLNELQIKYDRLEKQNKHLKLENKFLQSLFENEEKIKNDSDKNNEKTDVVELNKTYPEKTVLFGGHHKWQQKFSSCYPAVKIMSGVDNNFPSNVLSNKTELVILNSKYMSHSVFYKVKKLQAKYNFSLEYIID